MIVPSFFRTCEGVVIRLVMPNRYFNDKKVEQKKRPAPSPKVAPGSGKKAKQATPDNKSGRLYIYISCFI